MAKKRGTSGLSLLVGVDKPIGMSSHDVVNRCRRIFGERRVGHTGTLDPAATGALLVCVGPAARLDAYFTGHDKIYTVRVAFGASTDTDDAQGEVVERCSVPEEVLDPHFAQSILGKFMGAQKQLPPVYSALKVGGRKACDEARKGNVIQLEPRDIEVFQARLIRIANADGVVVYGEENEDDGFVPWPAEEGKAPTYEGLAYWDIQFHVSKGTYIRSLARDIGLKVGCGAHVAALRRLRAGRLDLEECVSLETLEQVATQAALDPIRLLGFRFIYVNEEQAGKVANGNFLRADDVTLCERRFPGIDAALCACTSGVHVSEEAPKPDEIVCVIADNKLIALYSYDQRRRAYSSKCVFPVGVTRGEGL